MKTLLIAALTLVLQGCITMAPHTDDMYEWTLSDRGKLPATVNYMSRGEMVMGCRKYGVETFNACAVYFADRCEIYLVKSDLEKYSYILPHEMKHCDGWDHKLKD